MISVDEALAAAWTICAPSRAIDQSFPRGFWPDVARVAAEVIAQQSLQPQLDFRPTTCAQGSYPEPRSTEPARNRRGKLSKAEKAENTRRLLAALNAKGAS